MFIVCRIKHCPVRGAVKVVESGPLSFEDAYRFLPGFQYDYPDAQFVMEELLPAEAAHFA